MNIRTQVSEVTSEVPCGDETTDEKGSEKERGSVEMHSVDKEPVITPDSDLDPVSLSKAFRFAAWSSVALVCDFSH